MSFLITAIWDSSDHRTNWLHFHKNPVDQDVLWFVNIDSFYRHLVPHFTIKLLNVTSQIWFNLFYTCHFANAQRILMSAFTMSLVRNPLPVFRPCHPASYNAFALVYTSQVFWLAVLYYLYTSTVFSYHFSLHSIFVFSLVFDFVRWRRGRGPWGCEGNLRW